MKYFIVIISILFIFKTVKGQDKVASFKVETKHYLNDVSTFSVSNSSNKNLAIFITEHNTVFARLLDENHKITASFETEKVNKKYTDLIGYKIDGDIYTLIWYNKSKNTFVTQKIDFNSKLSEIKEREIELENEFVLTSVQYNNNVYLLTANKENLLIIRKLNKDNTFYVLDKFQIKINTKQQKLLAKGFWKGQLFGGATSNITKIDTKAPISIEQTVQKNKLYQFNSKLFLTLEDNESKNTMLHTIDLESRSLLTNFYEYPKGKKDNFKLFSSFILEDHIIQMGSNNNELSLVVKKFDGTLIKEHYIDRNLPIIIRNSPIIQDRSNWSGERREMELTKKFLRKINNGDLGLTCYKDGNLYKLTIGGVKINYSYGSIDPMMKGLSVTTLNYNPLYYSYGAYKNSKSIYFNTTFDENFEYVKKDYEMTIFERMEQVSNGLPFVKGENLFLHKDTVYYTYYLSKAKTFYLYKI
ncbi:MAG: hypothetical protein ACI849_001608 [Patiriisocius sp.]|jgi:hypothetical protein